MPIEYGHPKETPTKAPNVGACGCAHSCSAAAIEPTTPLVGSGTGALLLRVPEMDCPTEEGMIRAALERFSNIRRLTFDLPGRALSIDVPSESWSDIVAAI